MLREWLDAQKQASIGSAVVGGALGAYMGASPKSVADKNFAEQMLVDTGRISQETANKRKKERTRNAAIRAAVGAGIGAAGGHYLPGKVRTALTETSADIGRAATRSAAEEAVSQVSKPAFRKAVQTVGGEMAEEAVRRTAKELPKAMADTTVQKAVVNAAEQAGAAAARGAAEEVPRQASAVKNRLKNFFFPSMRSP